MSTTPTTSRSPALQSQIDRVRRRAKLDVEIATASKTLSIRLTQIHNTNNPRCMAELSVNDRGESQLKVIRSPSEHAIVLDEAAIVRLRNFLTEHFPG